jgi:hypothetical protein
MGRGILMYTVNENDLKRTMVEVLKADGHNTLANMLEMSKLVYDPQWEFSGIISYQRKLYVSLRVPLNFRTYATQHRELLSKTCLDIYIDDDEYACYGIKDIGVLPIQAEEVQFQDKRIMLEKDSVYTNFIKFLSENRRIDELQKNYLFEACAAGNASNMLSASVMLGCSAEILLKNLCEAYFKYLQNNASVGEQSSFEQKVIKAKVAYTRLDEFLKRAEANPTVFERLGFENVRLNFNFLDIIRQTRNDSGHPTGNIIQETQFKMMLSNYQAFLDKSITAIELLPSM